MPTYIYILRVKLKLLSNWRLTEVVCLCTEVKPITFCYLFGCILKPEDCFMTSIFVPFCERPSSRVTSITHTQTHVSLHSANKIRFRHGINHKTPFSVTDTAILQKVTQILTNIYAYLTELHVLKLYLKYVRENSIDKSCSFITFWHSFIFF